QKTMEEMVNQWNKVQEITNQINNQLEKVAHIVKPSIQDFVNTQDMVRPGAQKSQFLARFTMVASVVAVLFSLVSMSLSQSARTVALNSEATRIANSQLFPTKAAPQPESLAYAPHEVIPAASKRTSSAPSVGFDFVGPRQKPGKGHR